MKSLKDVSLIAIWLLNLLGLAVAFESAAYLYHICPHTANFTRNSDYEKSRDLLLSSLASKASNPNGFYNDSAGNQVYGLFLCRVDASTDVCQGCVTNATRSLLVSCPSGKEAMIWYDMCLLRYSDHYIFSKMTARPRALMWNTQNISNGASSELSFSLGSSLSNAANEAGSAPSGSKRFGVQNRTVTVDGKVQTFYILAQCTPDLPGSDCLKCLNDAIGFVPVNGLDKESTRVLTPSCDIRYETYQFYNFTAATEALRTSPAIPAPGPVPFTKPKGKERISTPAISAIVVAVVVSLVLSFVGYNYCLRSPEKKTYNPFSKDNAESLQFDFGTIETSTRRFSDSNKLGQGGFGEVYKGVLANGQEIAVKRLSKSSKQGEEEFKNEVVLVAKLQHRNLVRLLGFCLAGEEKLLVYEFVHNKSLDYLLFVNNEKQERLNWSTRYEIIKGIARGILYLHEDSRLRIIHRDLKASNILLDREMIPKISDFGMARLFGGDQTEGSTDRIVGTYGYMAPEYGMHGQFSVKSDAYSFGVLILEIVSGRKNSSFYQTGRFDNLAANVWRHWMMGEPMEVMDPALRDSYKGDEVIRCIHIGLLCVQEDPADRPTMATVITMLNSYTVPLPPPQRPAFFLQSRREQDMAVNIFDMDGSTTKLISYSVNEVSVTELDPR